MGRVVQKAGRPCLFIPSARTLFSFIFQGRKGGRKREAKAASGEKNEEMAKKGNEGKRGKNNNKKAPAVHVVGPKSSGTFFFSQHPRYFLDLFF